MRASIFHNSDLFHNFQTEFCWSGLFYFCPKPRAEREGPPRSDLRILVTLHKNLVETLCNLAIDFNPEMWYNKDVKREDAGKVATQTNRPSRTAERQKGCKFKKIEKKVRDNFLKPS